MGKQIAVIAAIIITVITFVFLTVAPLEPDPFYKVNEIGALTVGIVFGWILVHTAWLKEKAETQWDWKAYLGVLAAVVGGAGVDYLFKTNFVGYFWTGIFIGFMAAILLRLLEGKDITMLPAARAREQKTKKT